MELPAIILSVASLFVGVAVNITMADASANEYLAARLLYIVSGIALAWLITYRIRKGSLSHRRQLAWLLQAWLVLLLLVIMVMFWVNDREKSKRPNQIPADKGALSTPNTQPPN